MFNYSRTHNGTDSEEKHLERSGLTKPKRDCPIRARGEGLREPLTTLPSFQQLFTPNSEHTQASSEGSIYLILSK